MTCKLLLYVWNDETKAWDRLRSRDADQLVSLLEAGRVATFQPNASWPFVVLAPESPR